MSDNYPQNLRTPFNRGNGLNRERRRPKLPTVSEFCTLLREHGLFTFRRAKRSMEDPQMQSFVEGIEEEQQLFSIAWQGGDEYMQVLANYMISQVSDLIPRPGSVTLAAQRMTDTWDDDLKMFAHRVENHDWYHGFSDDGNVDRAGQARYLELEKIATEKGGLYQVILSQKAQEIGNNIKNGPKKDKE